MGMLSDFLTLIKGTQTNIDGVLTGVNGKLTGTDVDEGSSSLATKGYVDTSIANIGFDAYTAIHSTALNELNATWTAPKSGVLVVLLQSTSSSDKANYQLIKTTGGNASVLGLVTTEYASATVPVVKGWEYKVNTFSNVNTTTLRIHFYTFK